LIPSVATWWCGEPGPRDYVLDNLARMVIKPAVGSRRSEPIFGEDLSAADRARLAEAIRARPQDYVGQEQLALSTTPVMDGQGLRPRHFTLRVFLAASAGTFTVMPGGLTRLAASADTLVVSLQKGGGSKDTWVVSDGPVSSFSLRPTAVQSMALYRDGDDLPSRAADNLFWLGRSIDRVDSAVRLLRCILRRATEQAGAPDAPEIPSLLRALCNTTTTYPEIITTGSDAGLAVLEQELAAIIGDAVTAGTLATSIHNLLRVARKVRDRLSLDMWRILSTLELPARDTPDDGPGAPGSPPSSDPLDARRRLQALGEVLDRTVINVAAFGGLVADGMTRGQGWRFLDMGRRLERSLQLTALLRSTLVVVRGPEPPLLEAILEVADSSMTYRRRYMSHIETAPVLDLLLADEANPRSLAFQLADLAKSIDRLPHSKSSSPRTSAQRTILSALTRLRVAEIGPLVRDYSSGYRGALDALLSQLEHEVPALSDQLSRDYFTHLQPPRQFCRWTEGEQS
jgi:uncharacterized alpha-E superfamily protein